MDEELKQITSKQLKTNPQHDRVNAMSLKSGIYKHNQKVEIDLIKKANILVIGLLFSILAVYVFYTFSPATTIKTSEVIGIFSTVVTFILGYLFGTRK